MANKTHIYEIHAKSATTKNWVVYESHENEADALRVAGKYKQGSEQGKKPKNIQIKVVKVERTERPVSERVIPSQKPVASKTVKKSNLDKMTDPKAKINAKKATDKKKPVLPRKPRAVPPTLPTRNRG